MDIFCQTNNDCSLTAVLQGREGEGGTEMFDKAWHDVRSETKETSNQVSETLQPDSAQRNSSLQQISFLSQFSHRLGHETFRQIAGLELI